jgi:sulfur relay (sulfurtransferase) complex TusBCD TusD component (DsrE family)
MAGLANKVIVLRGEGMGQGDNMLGSTILASFLRLCLESAEKPKAIFCYNGGVKLLTGESLVLAHLQELVEAGVKVEACRTCVDFYGIREQMRVGELSSMGAFMEYLQTSEVVML